ncbi:MAG: hypothetical protein R3A12_07880 [Ignavibacteria bacterium]
MKNEKTQLTGLQYHPRILREAVKFYNEIFGFELNVTKMGEDDLAFFPVIRRSRRSHIYISKDPVTSENGPILYLNGGDDLQNVLGKVESAGGRFLSLNPKVSPDVGYIAMLRILKATE